MNQTVGTESEERVIQQTEKKKKKESEERVWHLAINFQSQI